MYRLKSTQVDEEIQHFYRKQGYKEYDSLIFDLHNHKKLMKLFL